MGTFHPLIRRTARRLLRSPAYTLPVILTLAVGIGSTAAVYTLLDAVLLQDLPYPEPGRIVTLRHTAPGLGIAVTGQSAGTYLHYRRENRSFSEMGAYWDREFTITDGEQPERVQAAIITPSLLAVLNVPPLLGQWPSPTEEGHGSVVISYGLWLRRYGGDSSVVGRDIEINRSPRPIVAVMPRGFTFPTSETELWYANTSMSAQTAGVGVHSMFMTAIGRLRPGVSPQEAARDIDRMIPRLTEAYAETPPELLERSQLRAIVMPLKTALVQDIRPLLLLLGAGVAIMLLIVWANATTLVLLRVGRRQPEIAIERALGATTSDEGRRSLVEAVLLALAGGTGGVILAATVVTARLGFGAGQAPRLEDVELGSEVIAAGLVLIVISAVVLGVAGLAGSLRLRGSGSPLRASVGLAASSERLRVHRFLVVGQTALTVVLMIGSGLLQRSFSQLTQVDLGFDPVDVVTFEAAIPARTYSTYQSQAHFFRQVLDRIRAVPGVTQAAAVGHGLPLTPIDEFTNDAVAALAAAYRGPALHATAATSAIVSPEYFRTMRIPLLEGRTFKPGDLRSGLRPVIISASLAHDLFSGGDALNRQVRFTKLDPSEYPPFTIVGIVGDVPGERIAGGPSKRLYLPMLEDLYATPELDPAIPYWPFEMTLVVRTDLPPATVAAEARRIVHSLDPQVPVWGERTLESVVASSMADIRLTSMLFLIATATALSLAIVGIYGVISYAVSQRTFELGVRLAIGATPGMITRMVVREGARMAIAGIVSGLLAAVVLTRLLRAVLYEVSPSDLRTFVLMPALLLGLALLATYMPAHRAGRTDPVTALKVD